MSMKTSYLMEARPEKKLNIYSAAGTVNAKIGKVNSDVATYFTLLEYYVNGLVIQYSRVQEHTDQISRVEKITQTGLQMFEGTTRDLLDLPKTLDERKWPAIALLR